MLTSCPTCPSESETLTVWGSRAVRSHTTSDTLVEMALSDSLKLVTEEEKISAVYVAFVPKTTSILHVHLQLKFPRSRRKRLCYGKGSCGNGFLWPIHHHLLIWKNLTLWESEDPEAKIHLTRARVNCRRRYLVFKDHQPSSQRTRMYLISLALMKYYQASLFMTSRISFRIW